MAWAAEHRLRTEWAQTASIYALLHNVHRAPGQAALSAEEINPFHRQRREEPMGRVGVGALRMFLGKRDGER